MKISLSLRVIAVVLISTSQSVAHSDTITNADTIMHFDQTQAPLHSLNFDHSNELIPAINDFRIIEAYYLSNMMGERWAIVTFENSAAGKRILKNDAIVATFANGGQKNSLNLGVSVQGNERLTRAVSFGINQFPIVNVKLD